MASKPFGKALAQLDGLINTYSNMTGWSSIYPTDFHLLRTKCHGLIDWQLQVMRGNLDDRATTDDLLQYLPQLTSARSKLWEMGSWMEHRSQFSVLDPIIVDIVTALESRTKEATAGDNCSVLSNPSHSGILTPETEIESEAKADSETGTGTESDEPLAPKDNLLNATCAKVEYLVNLVEKLAITHQNLPQQDRNDAVTGGNGNRILALSNQLELPESVQDSQLYDILQQLLALDEKFQASGIQCSEVQGLIALCIRWLNNNRRYISRTLLDLKGDK